MWSHLEPYICQHPEKVFMVSCAADCVSEEDKTTFLNDPNGQALRNILDNNNVIVSITAGNILINWNKTLNESADEQEKGLFTGTSINSEKNNKYCVLGYDPYGSSILLQDNSQPMLPIGNF